MFGIEVETSMRRSCFTEGSQNMLKGILMTLQRYQLTKKQDAKAMLHNIIILRASVCPGSHQCLQERMAVVNSNARQG